MDEFYMRHALTIAGYAEGRTSPNPLVGAVIVKDSRIVGQGWHKKAGTPHAEVHALRQAGELAEGATMYVTLEPCSHHGRTPPCADAVIAAGIKRVVVAVTDPNPEVAGQGLAKLRSAGIEVKECVLASEAAKMNEVFIKWIATGLPFVVMKSAMSLDGKIAAYTGHSRWITSAPARLQVHRWRDMYDGILVGIGTVLADDPSLTTRLPQGGKNPVRIIVDSMARTPLTAQVITDGQAPTVIAVSQGAPPERVADLEAAGAQVIRVPAGRRGLCLRELFAALAAQRISSILVEGGAGINASVLEEGLADKVHWFVAPKIIGGHHAPGPVGGSGATEVSNEPIFEDTTVTMIGEDILISAYLRNREGRDVYRACGRIG